MNWWLTNEITYLLQSEKACKNRVLVSFIFRALLNQFPLMVYGRGLLLGSGVWAMSVREREQTALCKGCGWSFGLVNLYAGHRSGEWLCVECLDIQERGRV